MEDVTVFAGFYMRRRRSFEMRNVRSRSRLGEKINYYRNARARQAVFSQRECSRIKCSLINEDVTLNIYICPVTARRRRRRRWARVELTKTRSRSPEGCAGRRVMGPEGRKDSVFSRRFSFRRFPPFGTFAQSDIIFASNTKNGRSRGYPCWVVGVGDG